MVLMLLIGSMHGGDGWCLVATIAIRAVEFPSGIVTSMLFGVVLCPGSSIGCGGPTVFAFVFDRLGNDLLRHTNGVVARLCRYNKFIADNRNITCAS